MSTVRGTAAALDALASLSPLAARQMREVADGQQCHTAAATVTEIIQGETFPQVAKGRM